MLHTPAHFDLIRRNDDTVGNHMPSMTADLTVDLLSRIVVHVLNNGGTFSCDEDFSL